MKLSSDRIVIPLILALYVGILAVSGALMGIGETVWKQVNTAVSTTHPILYLLGIWVLIVLVYWEKRRAEMRGRTAYRKIVLKRNNTNILLYALLFGAIFGVVAYPIGIYLFDIGFSSLHSTLAGILSGHLTALVVLRLTVKIEPTSQKTKKEANG